MWWCVLCLDGGHSTCGAQVPRSVRRGTAVASGIQSWPPFPGSVPDPDLPGPRRCGVAGRPFKQTQTSPVRHFWGSSETHTAGLSVCRPELKSLLQGWLAGWLAGWLGHAAPRNSCSGIHDPSLGLRAAAHGGRAKRKKEAFPLWALASGNWGLPRIETIRSKSKHAGGAAAPRRV